MKRKSFKWCMMCLAVPWVQPIWAQADVLVSGANGSGTAGTVSYSVGQVAYTQYTGVGGAVNEGVQQAYTVAEQGIEEAPGISFLCDVFPNPTFSGVTFVVHHASFEGLRVDVWDAAGHIILTQPVQVTENHIPMAHLPAATYVLGLYSGQGLVKSFKIIKY